MDDSQIRVTSTHRADETEGSILGVSTPSFWWVALALVASLGLFNLLVRAVFDFICRLLVVSAAPCRRRDAPIASARTSSRDSFPMRWIPRSPAATPSRRAFPDRRDRRFLDNFPDAYLLDGLTVFDGPAGGSVAKGWVIQTLDLQTASSAELNLAQDAWAALLRHLSPDDALQVSETSAAGDIPRLLTYREFTEGARTQTRGFFETLTSLTNGGGWNVVTSAAPGRSLPHPTLAGWTPWRTGDARNTYDCVFLRRRALLGNGNKSFIGFWNPSEAESCRLRTPRSFVCGLTD